MRQAVASSGFRSPRPTGTAAALMAVLLLAAGSASASDLTLGADRVLEPAATAPETGAGAVIPGTLPDRSLTMEARGIVQPTAEAVLSSEIAGRIVELPYREGDRFEAGAVLVRFDCALYEARIDVSTAARRAAALQVESNQQLAALASIGRLDVQLSQAALAEATAELRLDELWAERCVIRAPFEGRVVEQIARLHETVTANDPLLSILSDRQPELRLVVPSRWLSWLEPGVRFRFEIDETGAEIDAVLTKLGPRIDPVSQTLPVFAEPAAPTAGIVTGMSGTARFARDGT